MPVKGSGEESEHGERVVLVAKGMESGALGVGSWHHLHRRQSSVRAELTLCPPPSSPDQPGSRFLIIWSVLDAKIKRKNELCALL